MPPHLTEAPPRVSGPPPPGEASARQVRPDGPVVENHDYAGFVRRAIAAHGRRVGAGDVEALPSLLDLERAVQDATATAVAGLRAGGYSWGEIAQRLGVTRQSAHERWGP